MGKAILFPGQGSQFVGMGKDLAAAFPEARAIFDGADTALGFPISKMCFEGPDDELKRTANTQPAILTHSIAMLEVLRSRRPDLLAGVSFSAGHSLGEYSADVAAGAILFADAVRTVHARGRFMQEAVPEGVGAMAAIIGLPPEGVAAACAEAAAETGRVVSPANYNAPEQTVISGHAEAVARAGVLCMARGAKRALPLPVSAPFHCALMEPAAARLAPVLAKLECSDPDFPVFTNVDALPASHGAELRSALSRQVVSCVRWVETIRGMASAGITGAIEIGPGAVLAGLVRRISPAISVRSLAKIADLEN